MLRLTDAIYSSMGKREITLLLSLDCSKAYDTVCREILLKKLEHHGIRDKVLQWFKSYLESRFQTVMINGEESTKLPITFGFPQGLILSPKLFILYTADLNSVLYHSYCGQYPDDTHIYLSATRTDLAVRSMQLKNDYLRVVDWYECNLLKLIPEKQNLEHFTALPYQMCQV